MVVFQSLEFMFFYFFFRTISPLILDQNYINLKNQVIKAERRVLKELGFCVHVKHPHKVGTIPNNFILPLLINILFLFFQVIVI